MKNKHYKTHKCKKENYPNTDHYFTTQKKNCVAVL